MILMALASILVSAPAQAQSVFLKPFVGSYQVVKRKCLPNDAICSSVSNLELRQNQDQTMTLREFNGTSVISEKQLVEENSATTNSYFAGEVRGEVEVGWWSLSQKNSSGRFDHTETVSFEHNMVEDGSPVKFFVNSNDLSTGKRLRRDFVLKK